MGATALFGGSFDPVHLGHVNVVKSLVEQIPDLDRVIIMPAFVNPFKKDSGPHAQAEQRIEMCRLAFGDIPLCQVSDYEIKQGGLSYTILTLEYLHSIYPDERLILTVGSDSLQSLPRWFRAEDILKLADIAAVSRSEEDSRKINSFSDSISDMGGSVEIISSKPFEISSTEIRKKILNNNEISCYIPENVVEYILCKKIYKRR